MQTATARRALVALMKRDLLLNNRTAGDVVDRRAGHVTGPLRTAALTPVMLDDGMGGSVDVVDGGIVVASIHMPAGTLERWAASETGRVWIAARDAEEARASAQAEALRRRGTLVRSGTSLRFPGWAEIELDGGRVWAIAPCEDQDVDAVLAEVAEAAGVAEGRLQLTLARADYFLPVLPSGVSADEEVVDYILPHRAA